MKDYYYLQLMALGEAFLLIEFEEQEKVAPWKALFVEKPGDEDFKVDG